MGSAQKICVNCGEHEVVGHWAGIPICEACMKLAELVRKRNEQQLQALLVLSDDLIRVNLAEGKLGRGEGDAEAPGARLHQKLQNQMRAMQSRGATDNGKATNSGPGHPAGARG